MSSSIAIQFLPNQINPRADLRRALLAAAETCWVYAILLTLSAMMGSSRLLSPLGIWFTYWFALEVGYYLPKMRRAWRALQWINLGLALLVILVVIRLDFYRDVPLFDVSWLGSLIGQLLGLFPRLTPIQMALLVLLYVYVRGVGFGQRPFTLWFIGFQFRLGVLIFFFVGVAGILAPGVNLFLPIVSYFVISLLSIALARIDESGREQGLGRRWAGLLVISILLVVLLGVLITPLFTLTGASVFFQFIALLLPLAEVVVEIIVIPLSWLLMLLLTLLAPLFASLSKILPRFQFPFAPFSQDPLQGALAQLNQAIPYLRVFGLIAFALAAGLIVARALNRRMMQAEVDAYRVETADHLATDPNERQKRSRAVLPRAHEIEAENVRRIYAALQARAASLDLPRREAETPLEFLPRLVSRFPQAETDLRAVTEAYVAVHYAQEPATNARVREIRLAWQRLRGEMVKSRHKA